VAAGLPILEGVQQVQEPGSASAHAWIEARLAQFDAPHSLDGRLFMSAAEVAAATPAAVLVPLVRREAGVTVLLTQRTPHLANHAGQISFPGGRVDAVDASAEETALRETEEEIGLPRARVRLLGRLPTYYIPTGFKVTPVVGWVEPPFALQLDEFEVAEAFEVPLAFFLDPVNHQRERGERNGRVREFFVMPYEGRNIWGATAGMLVSLYQALRAE
jgi:8-oxo-dGTP pyrophosphatase MutT (NUDIX family)